MTWSARIRERVHTASLTLAQATQDRGPLPRGWSVAGPQTVETRSPRRLPSTDHLLGLCRALDESMLTGLSTVKLAQGAKGRPPEAVVGGLTNVSAPDRQWVEITTTAGQVDYTYVVRLTTRGVTITNGSAAQVQPGDSLFLVDLVMSQTEKLRRKGRFDERVVLANIDGVEHSRRQHETEVESRAAKKGALWGGAIGAACGLAVSIVLNLLGLS
ncbi:hypothetical protein [Cellulosimicrobium sp. 22601]|uniref:hypothetical protein n=1 Tax=unclassified Cellulosimicrobium TaxID=2624466 RepID=UPI003F82EF87